MTRKTLLFILALCGFSAALGWWRADPSATSQGAVIDGWDAMQHHPLSESAYTKMARQVKASSLLPISRIAEMRANSSGASTAPTQSTTAGKFPKVLSRSAINRVPHVILQGPDNGLIKVKAGDTLESGWTIKAIEKNEIIATFETEEIRVPTVPYLQTAFEKSDEDAMDVPKDNNNASPKPTSNN
jgi:hypothetical protein